MTNQEKFEKISAIAHDFLDYDTHALHYILHVLDGHYGCRDDAAKLAAIQETCDIDEGRGGIAEIAAVLAA